MVSIFWETVVHDKFESFWPNFEVMTSGHGARISGFRENSFINEYLTSKFLLLGIFIFLSPLVHEIRVWTLFVSRFWVDDVTRLSQNYNILCERFHKGIIHLEVPFTFDFPLSMKLVHEISIWTFFTHFWVDDVTTWSQYFTSNFPLLLTFIFWSPLVHENTILGHFLPKVWAQTRHFKVRTNIDFDLSITLNMWYTKCFTQFGDSSVTKEIFQNVEESTKTFDFLKCKKLEV